MQTEHEVPYGLDPGPVQRHDLVAERGLAQLVGAPQRAGIGRVDPEHQNPAAALCQHRGVSADAIGSGESVPRQSAMGQALTDRLEVTRRAVDGGVAHVDVTRAGPAQAVQLLRELLEISVADRVGAQDAVVAAVRAADLGEGAGERSGSEGQPIQTPIPQLETLDAEAKCARYLRGVARLAGLPYPYTFARPQICDSRCCRELGQDTSESRELVEDVARLVAGDVPAEVDVRTGVDYRAPERAMGVPPVGPNEADDGIVITKSLELDRFATRAKVDDPQFGVVGPAA